ncbi:MAG: sulfur-carrier protein adenylyltransferase/sulfurtransferase [Myxococcales bacterium]|jgi:molybdopterin/thiamine biosynthesis adenylyltransferase/rhodanese-related sulfurtransferase|nr:sulfur-carrier protein adenylyltransferase/sulfurtransferase [Myxococcales bacterium]
MPTTYTDLIANVRKETKEVSLDELKRRLDKKEPYTLLDVREKEEYRAGYIPGAVSIPRGFLEIQVEGRLSDKNAKIVAYCAGGTRSALAAKTLAELGYTNVETANPGFVRWKDLGYPIDTPPQLTETQRDRYSRHLLLPEVGEVGQAKLLKAKVLLIGAGGLGAPASLYLAAAGIGTLGIVDADTVDASNLQRQVIHATSRVGMSKVDSAELVIKDLNPDVKVVGYKERVDSSNVERIFGDYDVIVDGTDNFPTRYLVNDASVFLGKPVVHGSIFRFDGQLTTFVPESAAKKLGIAAGPCYRCLYPEPPPPHLAPSCQEAGVLGILPGVVGLLQATEAIKLILGRGEPLVGRLLTYDSLKMKFRELKLRRNPECPVCGPKPSITSYIDYEGFCALPGG